MCGIRYTFNGNLMLYFKKYGKPISKNERVVDP